MFEDVKILGGQLGLEISVLVFYPGGITQAHIL
jgi:hypothetical protein